MEKNIDIKLRINNLELRKASYLGDEPIIPNYEIVKWEPNSRYGQQRKYIKDGDYYIPKNSSNYRIHKKNCFKHPECCYSIALFTKDKDGYYELSFVGDRPINLNEEEITIFWKIISMGYNILNKIELC